MINDLPLQELAESFQQVLLVDLCFLNSTRNKLQEFPNVEIHELDISNSLSDILDFKINTKMPNAFLGDEKISHVVSLNLLSQLALPARYYLERKKPGQDFEDYYRSLIINHLDYLQKFKAQSKQVLLISDVEKIISDRDFQELGRESSLQSIDLEKILPAPQKEWIWDLAPPGELDKNLSTRLKVQAFSL